MSKIEVDAIEPQSGTDLTIGASGDTITVPAGATLVNNGTASGFGISWQSVVTASTLTTVAGRGYPINTTSNACTVTLPSSASVGDQIQIVDYAGTFATNNITLTSSLNIEGGALDKLLTTNREGVTITYVDVTQGWVATSGVNSGDQALDPQTYSVDFLVIAGGGGGAQSINGAAPGSAGGAGGYRNSYASETSGGGGSSEASLTFNVGTVYTITVGAGGAGTSRNNGVDSSISGTGLTTITSVGGGYGGGNYAEGVYEGSSGGSGGGSYVVASPAAGTANQGYAGGAGTGGGAGDGGGGASAVGGNSSGTTAGNGGNGLASSITGSSVSRGGGGGGAGDVSAIGTGGTGGGGDGGGGVSDNIPASNGTANTGGGGGGALRGAASPAGTKNGGNGGSGVVILRMPDADYSGTTTGSPTVATGVGGTDTVLTFNASGSYTG